MRFVADLPEFLAGEAGTGCVHRVEVLEDLKDELGG